MKYGDISLVDAMALRLSPCAMARLARIVVPDLTQRGKSHVKVFFSNADYALYHDLLIEHFEVTEVAILT